MVAWRIENLEMSSGQRDERLGCPSTGFGEGIKGDSKHDDDADNDLLDVGGDIHEYESV